MPNRQTVLGTRRLAASLRALPASFVLAGSVLFAALASPAQAAANLSVYPLKLKIAPGRVADTVTLGNNGNRPVTVEARIYQWQYAPSGDGLSDSSQQLLPTTDLIATPPVFTLAPGKSRVVRIGRLSRTPPAAVEQGYRLELSEVPDEASRPVGGGAQTVLTVSLPVFVLPKDRKAAPDIQASWLAHTGSGVPYLKLANTGGLHARLGVARLKQAGLVCAEKTFAAYVLPASERRLAWADAAVSCKPGEAELQLDFEGAPQRLSLGVSLVGTAPIAPRTP